MVGALPSCAASAATGAACKASWSRLSSLSNMIFPRTPSTYGPRSPTGAWPPPFSGRERPLGLEPDDQVLGEEGAPPEPDRPREPARLHPPAQGLVADPEAGADLFY